jgi:hypothetical protein
MQPCKTATLAAIINPSTFQRERRNNGNRRLTRFATSKLGGLRWRSRSRSSFAPRCCGSCRRSDGSRGRVQTPFFLKGGLASLFSYCDKNTYPNNFRIQTRQASSFEPESDEEDSPRLSSTLAISTCIDHVGANVLTLQLPARTVYLFRQDVHRLLQRHLRLSRAHS